MSLNKIAFVPSADYINSIQPQYMFNCTVTTATQQSIISDQTYETVKIKSIIKHPAEHLKTSVSPRDARRYAPAPSNRL